MFWFFGVNLFLTWAVNMNCENSDSFFKVTHCLLDHNLAFYWIKMKSCFSYLAEDAAYVFTTGYITRVVEVLHDGVEAGSNLLIFLQITASKLGVVLAEDQWLLRLKRRLVVQTLGVRVPTPGLEEQHQHMEKEVRKESKVLFVDLWGHDESSLSPRSFCCCCCCCSLNDSIHQRKICICERIMSVLHHCQTVSVARRRRAISPKSLCCPHLIRLCSFIQPGGSRRETGHQRLEGSITPVCKLAGPPKHAEFHSE